MLTYPTWLLVLFLEYVRACAEQTMEWPSREAYLNQSESVNQLYKEGYLKSECVANAIRAVDLKYFEKNNVVNLQMTGAGVKDGPLPLYAYTLEAFKEHLKPGNTALDVSLWSFYLTTCMAYMVGESGCVIGLCESEEELMKNAIDEHMPHLLESKQIILKVGSPDFGAPEYAPYDAIHVGNTGCSPGELLKQLKNGGRLIMPDVINDAYTMCIYDKHLNGTVTMKEDLVAL